MNGLRAGPGRDHGRRALSVAATYVVYAFGFFLLEAVFGIAAGLFVLVFVAAMSLNFGARAGALAGALSFPTNLVVYRLAGYPWSDLLGPPAMAMLLACTAIGFTMGRLRDLRLQLRLEAGKLQAETIRLRAAEERIQLIGAVTNDVIWEHDTQTDNLWLSAPFFGRYGANGTEGSWSLDAWGSLVHPEDQQRVRAAWEERLEGGKSQSVEFRMRRLDGGYDNVLNRWTQVWDSSGKQAQSVGAMVNVTALKDAERVRADVAAKEQEILELQDQNRLQSNLLNVASHELNTPLAAMKLAVFVHRQAHEAVADQHDVESLDLLDRNVDRLAGLIRNTLDVSKLKAGRETLLVSKLDFAGLVEEAVAQLRPVASRAGVELLHDGPARAGLEGDKDRLFQVLFNLMGNAIKFTPKGGRVTVSYAIVGDELACEVRDTGLGIEAPQIGRLFRPFSQIHPSALPGRGAGLGLYISRGIVEQHGGRIHCESEGRERGTVFTFWLPLRAQQEEPLVARLQSGAP